MNFAKVYIENFYDEKMAALYFNHDFLINCYDWELKDEMQKIVKRFYDYSDCMQANLFNSAFALYMNY